jgi:hypothetical protein
VYDCGQPEEDREENGRREGRAVHEVVVGVMGIWYCVRTNMAIEIS